jgi:hypothetical protein
MHVRETAAGCVRLSRRRGRRGPLAPEITRVPRGRENPEGVQSAALEGMEAGACWCREGLQVGNGWLGMAILDGHGEVRRGACVRLGWTAEVGMVGVWIGGVGQSSIGEEE